MSKEPHIEFIARGVLSRGNSILACRNVAKGYYYLPGGHVEFGEAPAVAIARELMEECGVAVKVLECMLVCEARFEQGGRPRHEVNIVFHVEPTAAHPLSIETQVASLEPEIAFEWIDLARLIELDLRPDVLRAWLISAERLPVGPGIDWLSHPGPSSGIQ